MMFDPATPPGHPIECASITNILNDISNYAANLNFDGVVDICGSPARTVRAAVPTWICLPKFPMSGGKADVLMGPVFNNKEDDLVGVRKINALISGYCHHGPVIGRIPNCGCSRGRRLIVLINVMQLLKDTEVIKLAHDNGCYDDEKGNIIIFINNVIPAEGYALNVNGEGFQLRDQNKALGMFRGDTKVYEHPAPTRSMIQGHIEAGAYSITYVPWFSKSNVVCQAVIPDRRLLSESMPKLGDGFATAWRSYPSMDLVPNTTREVPTWGIIEQNAFNMLMASIQLTLNDWNAWFSAISVVVNNNKYRYAMKPQSPFFWTRVAVQEKFRQLTVLKNSQLINITDFKVRQPTIWNAIKSLFASELTEADIWNPTEVRGWLTKALRTSTATAVACCVFVALCVPGAQIILLPILIGCGTVVLATVVAKVAEHFQNKLTEHCVETIISTNGSCLQRFVPIPVPRELPDSMFAKIWLITQRELSAWATTYKDCLVNHGIIIKGSAYCNNCNVTHPSCICGQSACPNHHCYEKKHPMREYMDNQMLYTTHIDSSFVMNRCLILTNQKPGYSVRQQSLRLINGQPVLPCFASTRNTEVRYEGNTYDLKAVDDNDETYAFGGHGLKIPKIWNPTTRRLNSGICTTHALLPAVFRSFDPRPTCRFCAVVREAQPYPNAKTLLDLLSLHTYISDAENGRCIEKVCDVVGIRALRPVLGMIGGVMQPINCPCGVLDYVYCQPAPRAANHTILTNEHLIGGWCRIRVLDHNGALVVIRPGTIMCVANTKFIVTNNFRCMHSLASYGTASFNNYLGICSRLEYIRMNNYVQGLGCPNCWLNPGCMHTFETRSFVARPWAQLRGLAFSITDGDPTTSYIGGWFEKLDELLNPLRHEFKNTERYIPANPDGPWILDNIEIAERVQLLTDDQMMSVRGRRGLHPVGDWRYTEKADLWVDEEEKNAALSIVSRYNAEKFEIDMPKFDNKSTDPTGLRKLICDNKAWRLARKKLLEAETELPEIRTIETTHLAGGCNASCVNGDTASVFRHLKELYTYYESFIGARRPILRNTGKQPEYDAVGAKRAEIRFEDLTNEEVYEFSNQVSKICVRSDCIGLFLVAMSDEELMSNTGVCKRDILWDDTTGKVVPWQALGGGDELDNTQGYEFELPYRSLYEYMTNKNRKYVANRLPPVDGIKNHDGRSPYAEFAYTNTYHYCPIHNRYGAMTLNTNHDVREYISRKPLVMPINNDLRVNCLETLLRERGLKVFANRAEDFSSIHEIAHNQGKTVRIYHQEDDVYICKELGKPIKKPMSEFVDNENVISIQLQDGDGTSFLHATFCQKYVDEPDDNDDASVENESDPKRASRDSDSDEAPNESDDESKPDETLEESDNDREDYHREEDEADQSDQEGHDSETKTTSQKSEKPHKVHVEEDHDPYDLDSFFDLDTLPQREDTTVKPGSGEARSIELKDGAEEIKTVRGPNQPNSKPKTQVRQKRDELENATPATDKVQNVAKDKREEDPFSANVGDIVYTLPRSVSDPIKKDNILPLSTEIINPSTFKQFWVVVDDDHVLYCNNKVNKASTRYWNGCVAFVARKTGGYDVKTLYQPYPIVATQGETMTIGQYSTKKEYKEVCGGKLIQGGNCTWRYEQGQGERGCLDPFCAHYNRAIARTSAFKAVRPKAKQTFDPDMLNTIIVDLEANRVRKCIQENGLGPKNPINVALEKIVKNESMKTWKLSFYLVNGPWGTGKSYDYRNERIIVPSRCLKQADTSSRSETPHLALNNIGEGEDLVVDECYTYDMIMLAAYNIITKRPLVLLGDFMQFVNPNAIPHRDAPSLKLKRIWKTKIYRNSTKLQYWLTYQWYTKNPDWKAHKPEEITWEHRPTDDVIIKEEDLQTVYQQYHSTSVVYVATPKINSCKTKHDGLSEEADRIRQLIGESDVKIISSLTTQGMTTIVTDNPQTSISLIFYIPKFKSSKDLINPLYLVPITRAGSQGQFCICVGEGYDQFMEFYNNIFVGTDTVAREGILGIGGITEPSDPVLKMVEKPEALPRDIETPSKFKFYELIKAFKNDIKLLKNYIDMTFHEGVLAAEINEQADLLCLGRANELRGDKIYVLDDGNNIDNASFLNKIKAITGSNKPNETLIVLDWPVKTNEGKQVDHSITPRAAFKTAHQLLKLGYVLLMKWNHYRENYFKHSDGNEQIPLWYIDESGINVKSTPPDPGRVQNWFTIDCKEMYYILSRPHQLVHKVDATFKFDRKPVNTNWETIVKMPIVVPLGTKIEDMEGDINTNGNQLFLSSTEGPNWTVNAVGTIHSHIGSSKPHNLSKEDKFIYQSRFYKSCYHFVITAADIKRGILTCDVWWYQGERAAKLVKEEGIQMHYVVGKDRMERHSQHTLRFSPPDAHKPSHALFRNLDLQEGIDLIKTSPMVRFQESRFVNERPYKRIAAYNEGIPVEGYLGYAFDYTTANLAHAIYHRALGIQNTSTYHQLTTARYMLRYMESNKMKFFPPKGSLVCPRLIDVVKGLPSNRKNAILKAPNEMIDGSESWSMFSKGDEININGYGGCPRAIVAPPPKLLKRDLPVSSAFTKWWSENNKNDRIHYTGCMRSEEIGEIVHKSGATVYEDGDVEKCDKSARSWECRYMIENIFASIDTNSSEWCVQNNGWGSLMSASSRRVRAKGIILTQFGVVPSGTAFTSLYNTIKAKWVNSASEDVAGPQEMIYVSDDFGVLDPKPEFIKVRDFIALGMNWTLDVKIVPISEATYNSQTLIKATIRDATTGKPRETYIFVPAIIRGLKRYFIKTNLDNIKQLKCLNYAEQYGIAHTPLLRGFWKHQCQKFGVVKELTPRWKAQHRFDVKPRVGDTVVDSEEGMDEYMSCRFGLQPHTWRLAERDLERGKKTPLVQATFQHILNWGPEPSTKSGDPTWLGHKLTDWSGMYCTTEDRTKSQSYPAGVIIQ